MDHGIINLDSSSVSSHGTDSILRSGDRVAEKWSGNKKQGSKTLDFSLSQDLLYFVQQEDLGLLTPSTFINGSYENNLTEHDNKPISPFVSAAIKESQKSRTENDAATFTTTDDGRVDFFFHVMEQTSPDIVLDLLKKSWMKSPMDTLKLIGSLRDIKDGKGIRGQYQHALYWLYIHHPVTLYHNLPYLMKLGYWKDSLQFLIVIMFEGFVHPYFQVDDGVKGTSRTRNIGRKRTLKFAKQRQTDTEKRIYNTKIAQFFKLDNSDNVEMISKRDMDSARLRYARHVFATSPKYRIFHIRIAELFAGQLAKDLECFQGTNKAAVSLAAKWAPSVDGHFDRYTLIASTISLLVSQLLKRDFIGKTIPNTVYLARKFYQKKVCVPIRAHLDLPEIKMSRNDWGNINYKRIAAKSMRKNKNHFIKHDKERLEAFLTKPGSTVAGATLKPIELIRSAVSIKEGTPEAECIILEKQWTSLVDDLRKKGTLMSGAVAICDVSASMNGDPVIAAIGLTLLTMAQIRSPWNEICITFHEQPSICNVASEISLRHKVEKLFDMGWGGNTDFQATMRLILKIGITNKLQQQDMPKILFTFTDMEFDAAFPGSNETNFEIARKEFEAVGYKLPTMVFWNLRADTRSKSTPVQKNENGVILLSGWSGQLLSYVMNTKNLATCTPWNFVEAIINCSNYENLKIYD